MKKVLFSLVLLCAGLSLVGCNNTLPNSSASSNTSSGGGGTTSTPSYDYITIAQAKTIATEFVETASTERYYIKATVKSIENPTYGSMTITDSTGDLYVYGTYGADGEKRYSELEDKPYANADITLYGTLQNFNSKTLQIKSGWIIDFENKDVEIDLDQYAEMTIAAARKAVKETKVKLSGVVAKITYASGKIPSGFYLVDNTDSIYVYDSQVAARVSEGNTINIAAVKDYWILDTEVDFAQKFGYRGCNQVTSAVIISNDGATTNIKTDWVKESTVKEMINTPFTEDVTTTLFKVNALITKSQGTGFVNYYINDLDGTTGTYVYTQCNGSDFEWLDPYVGKISAVYLSLINAKSSISGCVWRFLPVRVQDEGYKFDLADAPEFVMEYYALDQFRTRYTGDPVIEVVTSVSSELLKIENATIAYSSSDENVVYFVEEGGKKIMHTKENGTATITITTKHGTATPCVKTVVITVAAGEAVDALTVKQAIDSELETVVTVKGIAGPSITNKTGFYLIDESGAIPVLTDETTMNEVTLGNEVVIKGTRNYYQKEGFTGLGQTELSGCTLVLNNYGKHEYPTTSFIKNKAVDEIVELGKTQDITAQVYQVTTTISSTGGGYANYLVKGETSDIQLYCSSIKQFSWIKPYFESQQTVTMEIVLCNFNSKSTYKGNVLSVIDPTTQQKVYNTTSYTSK